MKTHLGLPVTGSRAAGAAGLAALGALHAAWAAGSHWPAPSPSALARAVVGSDEAPGPAPTAAVAAAAIGAAALVAGAGGERRGAVWARRAVAAGLLARAGAGCALAATALGLPKPAAEFRRLDARYYRTICAVLGALIINSARKRQ
jgi:hypothetical protein